MPRTTLEKKLKFSQRHFLNYGEPPLEQECCMGMGVVIDIYGVVDVYKLIGNSLEVVFQREVCFLWGWSVVKFDQVTWDTQLDPTVSPNFSNKKISETSTNEKYTKTYPTDIFTYIGVLFPRVVSHSNFWLFLGWMKEIFAKTFRAQMVLFSQKKCMVIWDCALGHKAVLQGKKCALC